MSEVVNSQKQTGSQLLLLIMRLCRRLALALPKYIWWGYQSSKQTPPHWCFGVDACLRVAGKDNCRDSSNRRGVGSSAQVL